MVIAFEAKENNRRKWKVRCLTDLRKGNNQKLRAPAREKEVRLQTCNNERNLASTRGTSIP